MRDSLPPPTTTCGAGSSSSSRRRRRRAELLSFVDAPQSEAGALEIVENRWGLTDPVQRAMYLDAIPKQHKMILNAGCLIVPCFHHAGPLLRPETLTHLNAFASIWCCIENMLLAAAAEGIFGVTRIPFEEERQQLKTTLEVPEHYEVPCWLALGYPQVGLKSIQQLRVCAQERIHFDTW